jgi:hypothetical protein
MLRAAGADPRADNGGAEVDADDGSAVRRAGNGGTVPRAVVGCDEGDRAGDEGACEGTGGGDARGVGADGGREGTGGGEVPCELCATPFGAALGRAVRTDLIAELDW